MDWLERHKSEIRVQPVVVHLDFHANNVSLCDDDQMKVIDWTQISVSDYRLDLTWTLMIMGDYGQTQWGERILQTYCQVVNKPLESLGYFNVLTYTKLLANTVISSRNSPTELGMRPEKAESIKRKDPILRKLDERVHKIADINVPEWDEIC